MVERRRFPSGYYDTRIGQYVTGDGHTMIAEVHRSGRWRAGGRVSDYKLGVCETVPDAIDRARKALIALQARDRADGASPITWTEGYDPSAVGGRHEGQARPRDLDRSRTEGLVGAPRAMTSARSRRHCPDRKEPSGVCKLDGIACGYILLPPGYTWKCPHEPRPDGGA